MKALFLSLSLFAPFQSPLADQPTLTCDLTYFTRTDLVAIKTHQEDIKSLSRSANEALKASYELANQADRYTLGLVSALLLRGPSFEDIKPVEWDKAQIQGSLVYQDQPFNVVSIQGANIRISDSNKSMEVVSGTKGEFSASLYDLKPYSRFRLFPNPSYTTGKRNQKTFGPSVKLEVTTGFCKGTLNFDELPKEPITLVLTAKKG